MNELTMAGCMPSPLSSYLKGLGVLRLLNRTDLQAQAAWKGEHLSLCTHLSREAVRTYFLEQYAPTPVLAPWNGGSGFYEKDNKAAPKAIGTGHAERLAEFRIGLDIVEQTLVDIDRGASPKGTAKTELLVRMRGVLPDRMLEWFDAAISLSGENARFPPLLGTGGNDGRLDFTNNFMQRLLDVMDPETGAPMPRAETWLDLALFGKPAPGLVKSAIGQFAPGQVGGPNSTTGFDGNGSINPWDFILMIEGALMFAAATVRRHAQMGEGILSYPFTVHATAAGAGNLGAGDDASSRGELWMPLWPRLASFAEVRALLAEGRVTLGARPARDGLDFIRAVHQLGGYRGVDRFQRFGLLKRSGKAYLATPLERVRVTSNPQSEWIHELERDDWLRRFRRFAQGDIVAKRFIALRRRLEDALFDLAGRRAGAARMQMLLSLLGEIQAALAVSTKAHHEAVGPVPNLTARWVSAADDGTPAYRIACALASLHGEQDKPLPLRAQLFPVHPRKNAWIEVACAEKGTGQDPMCRLRVHSPAKGRLTDTLVVLLKRRLWLAEQLDFHDKPFKSTAGIGLDDLNAFLCDARMDCTITTLLPGFSLCNIPSGVDRSAGGQAAPAAFGLLRLVLTPNAWLYKLTGLPDEQRIPIPPGMVAMLASGSPAQARHAVETAWRRLRGSGLTPIMPITNAPALLGLDSRRLAAALMIPLTFGATGTLVRSVLIPLEKIENVA